ncbi:AraC family transcriptional regulator [Actinomycetes bacterium]|nr:AraC family transcriptional regulator [Actinomycetes bacterium]
MNNKDNELRARKDFGVTESKKREYPPLPEKLTTTTVDAHCHLDIEDEDIFMSVEDSLAKAKAVGITGIVQVGVDVPSSRWAVKTAQEFSQIHATVALHPNEAPVIALEKGESALDEAIAEIAELAKEDVVRAIGETGVDFFRTSEEGRAFQEKSFRAHIQIANKLNKPVMVHDRDAHLDALRILDDEKAQQVIFHCYSGDKEFAQELVKRGWYLSFAGTCTFKNAQSLRDALQVTPLENVLVETDAPFLTPMPYRGYPNSSYMIPLTLATMAQEMNVDINTVADATRTNAEKLFGKFE